MKINKKLLVVMLTLVVGSITLAGCGQKKENLPTPPVATVEPEATTQPTEIVEPEITAPPTETPVIEMDMLNGTVHNRATVNNKLQDQKKKAEVHCEVMQNSFSFTSAPF